MMDLRDQLQTTLGSALTVEHELGGGGMSRVFVAEDAALGRKVVVKVLAPELTGAVNVERFKREIQLAARLQHPHVVPVLSAGDIDGLPYFTMPLVDGQSLGARLSRGELPVAEAIAILRDVAKALEYAHSKGVIHRDIKPDNVLLTGGSATVTDFGVAKALSSSTQGDGTLTGLGVALGTPTYMAPEQAAADPNTDHRADIYAFGVMAYEMLAGRTPFAGRSTQQMLSAHMAEGPVPIQKVRPAIPDALATLVMQCLEKRPADRPQHAHDVLVALDAIGTPSGSTSVNTRSARRRWTIGIAAGAIAVLVAAAVPALRAVRTKGSAPARLVVAPFVNLTGDTAFSTLGRIAAEVITQGIQQTETIDVVSSSVVTVATEGASGGGTAPALAQRVHATVMVSGAVSRQGDSLRFQAQVTDVASSKLLQSVDGVMAPLANPMAGVTALRDRLMGLVAVSDAKAKLMVGGAPKYQAYQELTRGMDHFNHTRYDAAIPFFERAVAMDSSFGTAYGMLATSHLNRGRFAVADSIGRIAEGHRAEFTRVERTMLDVNHAFVKHDRATVITLMKELAARDSSPLYLYLIGLHSKRLNRSREAIRAFAAVRDTLFFATGWSPYFTNYAESYHQLGDFDGELEIARRQEQVYPDLHSARIRALAGHGDIPRVMALLDSLRTLSVEDAGGLGGLMLTAARELGAHGHPEAAAPLFRQAREWFALQPAAQRETPAARRNVGYALYALGVLDSARTMYATLVAQDSLSLADQGRLGAIVAHLGDRPEAERIAAALSRVERPYLFGEGDYQSAIVAAALGDKARAAQLLQSALGKGTDFSLRIHTEPEFMSLRGDPSFEAILKPKG